MQPFPSMKASKLLALLEELGYAEVRRKGSHRRLEADGRPSITYAFHDGESIAPGLVRRVLEETGLTVDEAWRLATGR